jgi:glycosyltransferase involved in cell wall biosynthesis
VDQRLFGIGGARAPEPFLLCVSTLHPHKNLGRLLRAFAGLHQERPEFKLVLAGMKGFSTRAVEELASDLGLGASVHITGWLPREHSKTCTAPPGRSSIRPRSKDSDAGSAWRRASHRLSVSARWEVAGGAALLFDRRTRPPSQTP